MPCLLKRYNNYNYRKLFKNSSNNSKNNNKVNKKVTILNHSLDNRVKVHRIDKPVNLEIAKKPILKLMTSNNCNNKVFLIRRLHTASKILVHVPIPLRKL